MAYEGSMVYRSGDSPFRLIPSAYNKQFRAMTLGVAIAFLFFAIELSISQLNQVHFTVSLPMLISTILALYIINMRLDHAEQVVLADRTFASPDRKDKKYFRRFLPYLDLAIVLMFLPYLVWLMIRAHRGQFRGYFMNAVVLAAYTSALVFLQACIHFLFALDGFMALLHKPREHGNLCPNCSGLKPNTLRDSIPRGRMAGHVKRDGLRYAVLIPEGDLRLNGLEEPSLEIYHDEEPSLIPTVDNHEASAHPQQTVSRPGPPARNLSLDTSAAYSQPSGRPSMETNSSLPAYCLE